MIAKPSLLMMMALAAGVTGVAHSVNAAQSDEKPSKAESAAPTTRMGASLNQDIAKRDRADSERARELDMQEQVVAAAQQRLESSMKDGKPRNSGGKSGAGDDGKDEFDQLAKIYQSMNPKKAAAVFEQLSLDVQLKVAQRMRERQTAEIMANMSPKAAAQLSMALAGSMPIARAPQAAPQPASQPAAKPAAKPAPKPAPKPVARSAPKPVAKPQQAKQEKPEPVKQDKPEQEKPQQAKQDSPQEEVPS